MKKGVGTERQNSGLVLTRSHSFRRREGATRPSADLVIPDWTSLRFHFLAVGGEEGRSKL